MGLAGPGREAWGMKLRTWLSGVGAAALAFSMSAGGAVSPRIVDLGSLGFLTDPVAISPSGQVVGFYFPTDFSRFGAFSSTPTGGLIALGTLGGTSSMAFAVNVSGEVIGDSQIPGGQYHAFSWTPSGGMIDLGTLGGETSTAIALNGSGEVVGSSDLGNGQQDAFSWTVSGGMTDLGPGQAIAINEAGEIVGNAPGRAVAWTPGGDEVTVALSGQAAAAQAYAINNAGEVVGENGDGDLFEWTQAGGLVDLGLPPGATSIQPVAINATGEIAATATLKDGTNQPVAWIPSAGYVSIGSAGPLVSARGINDAGVVAGNILYASSSATYQYITQAFLWTAASGIVDLPLLAGVPRPSLGDVATSINDAGQIAGASETTSGAADLVIWNTDTLTLTNTPADIAVSATGPAGAAVTYTPPTVADENPTATPTTMCLPPSGATFSIGVTTVNCTASDPQDANSPVSATFTVTVNGAAAQLQALLDDVTGVGPGHQLASTVSTAQRHLMSDRVDLTCRALRRFAADVGRSNLPQTASLTAQTANIRAVLSC